MIFIVLISGELQFLHFINTVEVFEYIEQNEVETF